MEMEQIQESTRNADGVDESDAPLGYRAALHDETDECDGCAFTDEPVSECAHRNCRTQMRNDRKQVMFVLLSHQPTFDARMRESLRLTHKDREARIRAQDSDSYGINRAERIRSWEMAAERLCPTPEPEKAAPEGLATLAPMGNRAGVWGA